MNTARAVWPASFCAALCACLGGLGSAPCNDDTNCPTGQYCDTGRCLPLPQAPAGSEATQLVLSGPLAVTSGTAQTYALTAKDAQGNAAAGYRGVVSFSSSDAQVVLPAPYAFTAADAGSRTFQVTLATAGSQSLGAGDGKLSASLGVAVFAAPAITSFTASPGQIAPGDSAALSAVFSGGTGRVDPGNLAISSGTPLTVSPAATTTYALTVTNGAGASASQTATVTVNSVSPPAITRFSASRTIVTAGDGVTLSFAFSGGSGSIDSGVGAVQSGVDVQVVPLSTTTTFTLTVTGAGSPASQSVTVTVVAPPAIVSFTASQTGVLSGGTVQLTARFSGGTGVVDHGVGPVTSGTPAQSPPITATTTFTLTVTNDAGKAVTATATVSISVGAFTATASLSSGRQLPGVASLPDGRILIAGGFGASGPSAAADIFDPGGNSGTGSISATGSLAVARHFPFAVRLPGGKVLVGGGVGSGSASLSSAELFDRFANGGAGAFSATGSMSVPRDGATATLLPNGLVLVAGGHSTQVEASAELYDPLAGSFALTGRMTAARQYATATLLATGKVLIVGGGSPSAEIYDPVAGQFAAAGATADRRLATAVLLGNGKVLIAGGNDGQYQLATATLYDPAAGFQMTGSLLTPRDTAAGVRLWNGQVLIAGGFNPALGRTELYDPSTGAFSPGPPLNAARGGAGVAALPNGSVLVTGGFDGSQNLASNEVFTLFGHGGAGSFAATASLSTPRGYSTATLLGDGRMLIAGGANPTEIATAELFDPSKATFALTGGLSVARYGVTATRLPNGRVLVAGGRAGTNYGMTLAEIYDPAANGGAGGFATTGSLQTGRSGAGAALLPTGKVLVAGGSSPTLILASAELFDPLTNGGAGTFAPTGSLAYGRTAAAVAALANGTVLIAGGSGCPLGGACSSSSVISSAEIYDPWGGTFTTVGPMTIGRVYATATPLGNRKVLVAGGSSSSGALASAELYDPVSRTFAATGNMSVARSSAVAILLPNGKVLVAGGDNGTGRNATAEVFDPAANSGLGGFSATGSMTAQRSIAFGGLLADGRALIAGGVASGYLDSAELYDFTGK